MVIDTTGQILLLVSVAVGGLAVSRVTRIEVTLACLLCGFLAGLATEAFGIDTGVRANSLREVVFFIILPVLIFEASWHLKPALLKRWLVPILILATVGVLISCFVSAALLYSGIGHAQGFPWIAALLTGAILAATDPIAVIGQLRAQHAPEDLGTLFEGESLFNDATAVVLFTLVLAIATGTEGAAEAGFAGYFAAVFFGGLVVGMVAGLVSASIALWLADSAATSLILVLTAFGSFYIAEHLFHISGIMAVVAAAIVVRASLSEVEDTVAEGVGVTWGWLGLLFNSVLFVIMGLVITLDMFREQWLAMLIAIAAALVARASAVVVCSLLAAPLGHRISRGWQLLLFWGGLRGAIALALVLSLPVALPYWYTVQSMVFGVVLFSLLVQGTTNQRLIARFGKA